MMSRETPFIFLLLMLISILMVFYLPSLGNLLINKGNPFRDNLCFSKDMLLAHKENPSRDNLQPSQGMRTAHKDNPSRDNLRPSQGMRTTRKDNPYRDNLQSIRDYSNSRKGNITILKVNLYSLTLWSNQGNLKEL